MKNKPPVINMKHYIFITITMLLHFSVSAQSNISEILTKLKNTQNDSTKSEMYRSLFEHYEYADPDSAIYYLEDGLKLFSENNYKPGVAFMTTLLGYEDAAQGRLGMAKKRQEEGLRMFEELSNEKGIALAQNGLGIIDGKTGNYNEAAKHFMIALKASESNNNVASIFNTYMNLGVVNGLNDNLDKALEYYNKALAVKTDSLLNSSTITLYNNIGIIYAKKGDLKKSLEYFQTALQKSNKPEFAGAHISSLINLGIVYDKFGDNEKALKYLNEGLQITKDRNIPEDEARMLVNISSVTTKTNPAKAIEELKEALAIAKKIGQKAILDDVYSGLAEDYRKTGNYKDAVAILEDQINVEDSTFSIEKAKEIANLEAVYELEKSNARIKELDAAQHRNQLKRNIIIGIAISLAFALILISIYFRKTQLLNEKLSKREVELAKSNTVKDKLFSIIGHDLRGPIGNIPMMLKIFEDESTTPDERNYLFNALMEHSQASIETLDKLLYWGQSQIKGSGIKTENFNAAQYIQNNIKLVKSSAEQKQITLLNKVPDDITIYGDPTHFDFILRNLLSNAVKFTHTNGTIEVATNKNKRPGFTIFAIKDNGIGIEKTNLSYIFEPFSSSTIGTANEKGTSMGLMLCKEFVKENGGDIWVESEQGKGSTFYFSFKNA